MRKKAEQDETKRCPITMVCVIILLYAHVKKEIINDLKRLLDQLTLENRLYAKFC